MERRTLFRTLVRLSIPTMAEEILTTLLQYVDTAMVGSMLQIKPVLHVDEQGRLIPMEKCRGRKAALQALADHMEKDAVDPEDYPVFISHGDCLEEAEALAEELRRRLGVKEVFINYVGPVIGSHTGAGVMALFFVGRSR